MSLPSMPKRMISYLQSRNIWLKAGKPFRPIETIKDIFNTHCKECIHYTTTKYACDICGCYINEKANWNKIAWSTTRCPDEPPKWIEEKEYQPEITITETPVVEQLVEQSMAIEPEVEPLVESQAEPPVEQLLAPAVIEVIPPEEIPPPAPAGGCGCGGY